MILYEVTLDLAPTVAGALPAYLRDHHIPQIFATGCFQRIRFDQASDTRVRTCYMAASRADLDRYLDQHAPRMRAEFAADFPAGVTLSREVWTEVTSWP